MAAVPYPSAERLNGLSQRALLIGLVGLAAGAVGLFIAREQFFRSYLTAFYWCAGLGVGSLGILLLHLVVGGNWGTTVRRVLESGALTVPLIALFFVPIIFGLKDLYIWARPEVVAADPVLIQKAKYLNPPFLIGRAVVFFTLWTVIALSVARMSLAQDANDDDRLARRLRRICGPLIIVHVMAVTFSSFDWIMSLEPHWYSTIFGALSLAGQMLATVAFLIAVFVWLCGERVAADPHMKQSVYDLGNLMLAFTMFWAYLAFSQLLIIWAGNLPEEIPWYQRRLHHGWGYVAVAVLLLHFAFPFLMLINRYVKRSPRTLSRVALLVIVMRLVEIFFEVAPAHEQAVPFHIHWLDIALPIGLGGIWLAVFLRQLGGRWNVPSINHLADDKESHVGR